MSVETCHSDDRGSDNFCILRSGEKNERAGNDKKEAVKIMRKEKL